MTFLTLEVSEQKFKQSLGRDLTREVYKSSISVFKMNFKVSFNSNALWSEGLINSTDLILNLISGNLSFNFHLIINYNWKNPRSISLANLPWPNTLTYVFRYHKRLFSVPGALWLEESEEFWLWTKGGWLFYYKEWSWCGITDLMARNSFPVSSSSQLPINSICF